MISRPRAYARLANTMLRRLTLAAAVLTAIAVGASRVHPARSGLTGLYYSNDAWAGQPEFARVDVRQDTNTLFRVWPYPGLDVFSVTWSGSLLVLRGGSYTFSVTSDDGAWLTVDGRIVVDNRGTHSSRTVQGDVALDRGTHAVRIQYEQSGGDKAFEWRWGRTGEALNAVPIRALTTGRAGFAEAITSAAIWIALDVSEWMLAVLLLLQVLVWLGRAWVRHVPRLVGTTTSPALPVLLAASFVLTIVPIWWGLPGGHWGPDEITPQDLWFASAAHFANGWSSRYPPLHFYLLTAVCSPVWLLEAAGRLELHGIVGDWINSIATRSISVAASIGSLLFLYATAERVAGRRAALFAVVQMALSAPFVYYSKMANLDVPYLFYFAVALYAYVRIFEEPRLSYFVTYSLFAALAMCTKDQAYGLFVLPSLLIFWRVRQSLAQDGAALPTLRTLVDRRMLIAVAAGLGVFVVVHNLLFNWAGFMAHIQLSAGGASQGEYRLFPNTLRGQWDLLRLTVSIARAASGWPFFIATLAGFVLMWVSASKRLAALLVTAPIVSYYLTFVAVIGFNYDRFILPLLFLGAVFGGYVLARLTTGRFAAAGRVVGGLVAAYSLAYALAVDVAMVHDSRYRTERFLAAQPGHGSPIGWVFPDTYYPRLPPNGAREMASPGDLLGYAPPYFVLNEEYADFERPETERGQLVAGLRSGALGYHRIYVVPGGFRFPWLPWPHPELRGPRPPADQPVTSSLRHITPTFGVYARNR